MKAPLYIGVLGSDAKPAITPTNRQKLEAQKTCDIIISVSLMSSADLLLSFGKYQGPWNREIGRTYMQLSFD